MILQKVILHNFRNLKAVAYNFHPSLTVIIGANALGKTNLLESIYFSISGSGFRESKEEELVNWEELVMTTDTRWIDRNIQHVFLLQLAKKEGTMEKKYFVDKVQKTSQGYREFQTGAVLFAPEHVDIITGSPEKRRDFLNRLISLVDPVYKRNLYNYEHALRRRNKVLEHHSDQTKLREELIFWNNYLVEQGAYITRKRVEVIAYLNAHTVFQDRQFQAKYTPNEITHERLEQAFQEEVRWRRTVVGPQKDDFSVFLTENSERENVQMYGSRSEQRLAVFWLKLNELLFCEEVLKQKPLLLLDDVFSELDTRNKRVVLELITHYQTIITTTESELLELTGMEKETIQFERVND
ncbi:DNA replication and repair protein RecF [Candidatus Roizmanbacteria bacterium]|nr:DNA replication and repair protein RecF [Candidatus Roizmanbacteria bacterium]